MLFRIKINSTDEQTYLVVASNGQMVVTTRPDNYDGAKPGNVTWNSRFTAVEAALHVSAYFSRPDLITVALPRNPKILLDYNVKFEAVE